MKVGLLGYADISTGLGTINAMLWRRLPLTLRYIESHPHPRHKACDVSVRESDCTRDANRVLDECDAVLFVERPFPEGIVQEARRRGKRVVCVVMCDWTPPDLPWLRDVDLFIAPTDQCLDYMRKAGFGGNTVRLNCPMDLDLYPFRERTEIKDVVYLDGGGGGNERKGWKAVNAVRSKLDVRVKSQRRLPGAEPAAEKPADLYADADCVLMPSRYDGFGLTLFEAMASGCVVLATDAPPYREFMLAAYGDVAKDLLLPVKNVEMVRIWSHKWPAANVDVPAIVKVIERVKALPSDKVTAMSHAGREYIEREHGDAAWTKLWEATTGEPCNPYKNQPPLQCDGGGHCTLTSGHDGDHVYA